MYTKKQKINFWKKYIIYLFNRTKYTLLGLIIYPFIKRNKVREKIKNDTGNWWTKILFYAINDDDIQPNGIDWSEEMVNDKWGDHFIYKRIKGTKLGNLWASYWYNALRNPAYNYLEANKVNEGYNNEEIIIDNLTKCGDKIDFRVMARWAFITKDGRISNRGYKVSIKDSIVGEAYAYWTSNDGNIYAVYTHAIKYKFLLWTIYESSQIGVYHSGKQDFKFKEHWQFNGWKFWKNNTKENDNEKCE